jgi:hypothetical protein
VFAQASDELPAWILSITYSTVLTWVIYWSISDVWSCLRRTGVLKDKKKSEWSGRSSRKTNILSDSQMQLREKGEAAHDLGYVGTDSEKGIV